MKRMKRCLCLLIAAMSATALMAQPATVASRPAEGAPQVRNLIYMIGDGMGLTHVSMLQLAEGLDHPVSFMEAENIALIKSHSHNNRVTDSAAAGTALATGHKTDNGMLGVLPDSTAVESMMTKAARQGMATGIVVTCYLPHATPGAFFAHQPSRNMLESIAGDLVGSGIDVAFGGGRRYFTGRTAEGTTLVEQLQSEGYRVIEELAAADTITSGRVVGLFAEEHLPQSDKGRGDYLPRAVEKALEILTNDAETREGGMMLMVEGSQIDWASHSNDSEGILAEMRDFDRTIRVAMKYVDEHPETLLVVTADHETGGLTLPSGNVDFTQAESGVEYHYGTKGHTGVMVPVYLYGAAAEQINGIMENTELAQRLMELLGLR